MPSNRASGAFTQPSETCPSMVPGAHAANAQASGGMPSGDVTSQVTLAVSPGMGVARWARPPLRSAPRPPVCVLMSEAGSNVGPQPAMKMKLASPSSSLVVVVLVMVALVLLADHRHGSSDLAADAEAGDERQARDHADLGEVVVVSAAFFVGPVVGVLDVQIGGDAAGAHAPGLLDAKVQPMEGVAAGAVDGAVGRLVGVGPRVVDAAHDRRDRVAGHVAEGRRQVPAAAKAIGSCDRQDVRLVPAEQTPFLAMVVALAARKRVRQEPAGLRGRPKLRRCLAAVDPADAVVVQVLARRRGC